jgi:PKD repeat protein
MLKSIIIPIFLIVVLHFQATASNDVHQYSDNWGKAGFTVESQNNAKILINYSIDEFALKDLVINGEAFLNIELPNHFLPADAGAPNLPGSGRYVAIPQGSEAILNILSFRTDTLYNINLAPSFRIPYDTEKTSLDYRKDESIYSVNKFFPEFPIKLGKKDLIRGIDVAMLGITPFQYNPVSKQLIIYRDIKIEISFNNENGHFGDDRLRSRWWDPILSDMLLNYESLPKIDFNQSYQYTDETGCEYLIIVPNDIAFQVWADSIKEFRTKQGIYTKVVSLSEIGGNTATLIENYIDNAYNTWDIAPAACLILGDYGTDASDRIIAPIWDNYCVSDNVFADVNGNELPDIVLARITAQDEIQLEVMVSKFLDYENNPPISEGFYDHPITSLGWKTDSWFQLCSEVIGGFWREAQGKDPVRINEIISGTPDLIWSTAPNTEAIVNYFGPDGLGYIPAYPNELGGWSGGTADMINTAIDSGAFMVQHSDHGSEAGWGTPEYTMTNINSLINTKLTFVWSVDDLTGKYNYGSEVFAEKFHRYTYKDENSGCFGINAPSEITYAFVNYVYVWGAYDNMWPDFMPDIGSTPEPRGVLPAFASASGKYFLEQSSWPYNPGNKEATYNLFHHHGDAFTTVYSEVPQNLNVSHDNILYMGETTFEVSADVDALIALSVNGELIGTGIGTGAPIAISIPAQAPPDHILITVTKQNYFRYEGYAEVIPSTGPYVVYNAIEINDDEGNGNGIMETSELIFASITVKNVGVEDAENIVVTLSSVDPYVAISDDTENYGDVSAGSTAVVLDGFSWEVANNIPDMHNVIFEVSVTDGSLTWEADFSLIAHAPLIEPGNMLIDDYDGNWNGRLDPGETAFLIIQTFNNGSFNAENTIGSLSCSSEHITLNNSTFNFYDIGVGNMEEGMFNVTVSEDAPAGTHLELMYDVTSGGYNFQEYYSTVISPVVEDWESGDMTQFEWFTGGDSDWEISSNNPYEGNYCIKSGTLDHDQSNFLSLEFESASDDSLSFWCRVSSESGYDYMKFYIDDIEVSSWSGEVAWERSSYLLTQGLHSLKWMYEKDDGFSSGEDCVWIDYIVFPIATLSASFNSNATDICEGEFANFYDQSTGGPISWDWTFEGGTPSTSTIQNPVIQYSSPGIFDVSLTVSDGTITNTVELEDYISVVSLPEQAPSPTGPETVCANLETTAYSITGLPGITDYSWLLEPAEAGDINGNGLSVEILWTSTYVGDVTLKVAGENSCGLGAFSVPKNITRYLPEVSLEPFNWVCLDWPAFELSGGMPAGGEYSGPGVENGWFNPTNAGTGTHTITYTYSDPDLCENFATETILVDPCTGIINSLNNSGIRIYPNPSSGMLTIEFENNLIASEVKVVNTLNKVVYTALINTALQKKIEMDLSSHSKGIYFIKVKTDKKEEILKLVLK